MNDPVIKVSKATIQSTVHSTFSDISSDVEKSVINFMIDLEKNNEELYKYVLVMMKIPTLISGIHQLYTLFGCKIMYDMLQRQVQSGVMLEEDLKAELEKAILERDNCQSWSEFLEDENVKLKRDTELHQVSATREHDNVPSSAVESNEEQ